MDVPIMACRLFCAAIALLSAGLASAGTAGAADAPYRQGASIAAADGPWDYASVDADARRLYVARGDGVLALDLDSGRLTPTLVPGQRVHGVLPLGGGLAVSTNGDSNTATLFNTADGAVLASLPTGTKPDAVVRAGKLVAVMDGKQGDITLIDPAARAVVGHIAVGGALEFAAADAQGHLYVNVEDRNELVVVDLPGHAVLARRPLADCDGPTGLALDPATGILVTACSSGRAVAMNAADGHVLASLSIGQGADAVILDARNHRFLIPCGHDGVLTVLSQDASGVPAVTAMVPTEKGARTGALDPVTGRVYLPTATFEAARAGGRPSMVPGSFHVLVLEPAQ
ncbi:gluconolactonase [Nitrospirillum viridazoti CBAmc]|uniref:Gluconolactonase n=2 Tax=Nitrospirillum TaxID=1543705 RepID=A0A248JZZ6_9PROT|nr:gluconolactonase [Nitrospirillum amazonense CBAmc]